MSDKKPSQFNDDELSVQTRLGVTEAVAEMSDGFIRPEMPDQHRAFFCQLPMVILALTDDQGYPWVMPLFANADSDINSNQSATKASFITSPNATTLNFSTLPKLTELLKLEFSSGQKIGMLGIDLATRRRNRLNGLIKDVDDDGFAVHVEQSFGNCPQYIQTRNLFIRGDNQAQNDFSNASIVSDIDASVKSVIENADTFFIASRSSGFDSDIRSGLDASHRGGKPGFVKVDGNTLSFPDFSGNRFYNTLGNIESDGRVGLVFPDFVNGNALLVVGRAEIDWSEASAQKVKGAERVVQVRVERLTHLADFIPLTGELVEMSPMLDSTGIWTDNTAEEQKTVTASKEANYQRAKLIQKQKESDTVTSFYFKPLSNNNELISAYVPGQFLPVQIRDSSLPKTLHRSYTLSSASAIDNSYKISVKREANGIASRFLHDELLLGETINVGKPAGQFTLQDNDNAIVFISGGIGITPMIAMLEGLVNHVESGGAPRPVWFFHGTQNSATQAFSKTITKFSEKYDWLQVHIAYSQPVSADKQQHTSNGRISMAVIKEYISLNDPSLCADFYLCGSEGFMQTLYQGLVAEGVGKANIFYEFFGEGSLLDEGSLETNQHNQESSNSQQQVAERAQVVFTKSSMKQDWRSSDGNLLEFAEKQGLAPSYGCRMGNCGACACKLNSGKVTYPNSVRFKPQEGEVLLCAAVPSKDSPAIELDL